MAKSAFQKFLDSGVEFTEVSRKQAESLVKQLVKAGEIRKRDADDAVQALLKRSRDTSERIADVIQREVNRQVEWMSERFDELEDQFEELNRRLRPDAAKSEKSEPAADKAAKKTAAKKSPAKKSPAKKTAAKKTAAKKTAAKKTPAKKSPAKETPAKETTARETPVTTASAEPPVTATDTPLSPGGGPSSPTTETSGDVGTTG